MNTYIRRSNLTLVLVGLAMSTVGGCSDLAEEKRAELLVSLGTPCDDHSDCKPDEYCGPATEPSDPPTDSGGIEFGKRGDTTSGDSSAAMICKKKPSLGGECGEEIPCADGFICHHDELSEPARDICVSTTCEMPVIWEATPSRQTMVTALVHQQSPLAVVNWSAARNTFSEIWNLNVSRPCDAATGSASEALRSYVRSNRYIFQVDVDEWTFANLSCANVSAQSTLYKAYRKQLGVFTVVRDQLSFYVSREGDQLLIRHVLGLYLPTVPPRIEAALLSCEALDETGVADALAGISLPHRIYSQCQLISNEYYVVQPSDIISITSTTKVYWQEITNATSLRRVYEVELRVPNGASMPEFQGSTAVCPVYGDPNGPATGYEVGWLITLDAVTGELISSKAGITCTVC